MVPSVNASRSRHIDSDEEEEQQGSDVEVEYSTPEPPSFNKRTQGPSNSNSSVRPSNGYTLHDDNDENEASGMSSSRRKKRRVEGSGSETAQSSRRSRIDAEQGDEDYSGLDASLREEEIDQKIAKNKNRLIRDPADGYVMGSVVRIKCHNFMTYADIECTPGPNLNIIFGPNGSGKSSLAAAIAVGLGFSTKVTGRTKDLQNMVKHRTSEGFVEIELKGKPGQRNLVIKRNLRVSDNKTTFSINGQQVAQKEVTEAVQKLNVNVDNLCSFLPQDRVAGFAKMSGAELLKETQRVVNPKLLDQQEKLADMKTILNSSHEDMEKQQSELVDKERRLASLEKDVKRHKEKQRLEEKVIIYEGLLPYIQYSEEKAKHDNAKRARNQAKEKLDALNDSNAPLLAMQDSLKTYSKAVDGRRKEIMGTRDFIIRQDDTIQKQIKRNDESVDKLRGRIKELKEAEVRRAQQIVQYEKDIARLQESLADEPPAEQENTELNDKIRAANLNLRAHIEKINDNGERVRGFAEEIDTLDRERERVASNLKSLNDVQQRRDQQCRQEDATLMQAASFVREKRRQFKGTVFDPIRLSVGVKDARYARHAEAAINYQCMKTMVCTEYEDYDYLVKAFRSWTLPGGGTRDLRQNVAHFPPSQAKLDLYPKPCSPEQLHELGFDAFVIDLLEGPEHVLAYLCSAFNLHKLPIAFGAGERIQHGRLHVEGSLFLRYLSSQTITSISFARYGQKKPIIMDNLVKDPRIFAHTIDHARKRELELAMAELDAQRSTKAEQRDEAMELDKQLQADGKEAKAQKAALDEERDKLRQARAQYEKKKISLRTAKENLRHLKLRPSEEQKRKELAARMKDLTLERLTLARSLRPNGANLVTCQTAETVHLLHHLYTVARSHAVDTAYNDASEEAVAAKAEFENAQAVFTACKASAKACWQRAEECKTQIPNHLYDEFQAQMAGNHESADEFAQKIADLQGELELIANVNPQVVRRYEELKADVAELQKSLQRKKDGVREARDGIDKLHSKWYPEIDNIVQTVSKNFSAAMSGLGCIGEVNIKEDDDYNKWEIKILVSFRDNEPVSELTAQRQSGGERSLVTMLYLISLLELSKVPFSLVDEINQGMDLRAERAVHNHLVHAVCEKENRGQYFLLTPKLLTNLNYHERVKILCVNNGEWLPEELPLRDILATKLASRSQRRA